MQYIRKISDYMIAGGIGVMVIVGMQGCEQKDDNKNNVLADAAKTQGALVIIDETAPGQYKIAEEYPSATTRIILRNSDGSERILSQAEIDKLVKDEAAKIDSNTSPLTNPQMSSNSMGLGGILLSSIAGAMIGSWIGGKLFNNQNFQNQRAASYKSPQAYSRSTSSFNKPMASSGASSTTKSSGFFGANKSGTTSSGTSTSTFKPSSGS